MIVSATSNSPSDTHRFTDGWLQGGRAESIPLLSARAGLVRAGRNISHCKLRFLKALAFALAIGAGAVATAEAPLDAAAVPQAQDLHADGRDAESRRVPILLVFASETCPYCIQLENDYLLPMLTSGEYTDRLLVRKVLVRDTRTLKDFDGTTVEAGAVARRYGVDLVPTLVFVDAQGRELAERLVGLGSTDFYWGYLLQGIDSAYTRLHVAAP